MIRNICIEAYAPAFLSRLREVPGDRHSYRDHVPPYPPDVFDTRSLTTRECVSSKLDTQAHGFLYLPHHNAPFYHFSSWRSRVGVMWERSGPRDQLNYRPGCIYEKNYPHIRSYVGAQ